MNRDRGCAAATLDSNAPASVSAPSAGMTSRERVLCALNHKEADRVPLDIGAGKSCKMHAVFYRSLLEHFGMDEEIVICTKAMLSALASDAMLERLESDVRCTFPPFLPGPKQEEWEDESYRYYRNDWGTVMRMAKALPLYYDMYEYPIDAFDPSSDGRYVWPEPPGVNPDAVVQAKRYQAAGYPVVFIEHFGNGFLQNGPSLFGFDNWLVMLAMEEQRVAANLDRLLELKMRHFDNVLDAFGDSVDVVCECDDLGTQNAPFVSTEMFRKLFKPYWQKLFARIKKFSNAKILMHCCGAVEPLLGDLIDVGVDIINPVQISAKGMDPIRLKREYGRDLTFWGGGIDTQNVLPKATPAEIRDHVKRNIEILAKDGGFVFATVQNIQADVPIENFMAMWEAFMDNRKY